LSNTCRYALKRLGGCAVSLALLSFVIFSLLFLAPGDPARALVGVRKVSPELLEAIREQYHLNDPFLMQYARWAAGALRGDFGDSIKAGYSVVAYVLPHAVVTFQLIGIAIVLSVLLGVGLGIVSARNKGRPADRAIDFGSLVGTSAPSFAVGLILLYVFSFYLKLFPMYGVGDGSFTDTLRHLFLPALTLTLAMSAMLVKTTRAAMLKEIGSDYTTFMRARGIGAGRVTVSQLRNASGPVFTSWGLALASLLGSSILIENVFSIPGLGVMLTQSVTFGDVPAVQFIALLLAACICLSSALIDILLFGLNPNKRGSGE